jgi:hypothetical protein
MSEQLTLSIILPAYRGACSLREALALLARLDSPPDRFSESPQALTVEDT